MNPSAYKYSICGLSIIGPMTKYIEIINTTYGMMIGTFIGEKENNKRKKRREA